MTKKLPPANQIESAPRVELAVASRWLMTGASHAVFLETSVYSEAQEKWKFKPLIVPPYAD
jgi:hypothetical protein